MKTIRYFIWLYNSLMSMRMADIPLNLKETYRLCKEMLWMKNLASKKEEAK